MAFYLKLDSISTQIEGAWQINRSLLRLLGGPAKRGQNRILPTVAGRTANTKRPDQTIYDLEMLVKGNKNHLGVSYPDAIEGKAMNLRFLQVRYGEAQGLLPAVLYLPDDSTLEADVQVDNWEVVADNGVSAMVAFDLVLVAGVWTEGGS